MAKKRAETRKIAKRKVPATMTEQTYSEQDQPEKASEGSKGVRSAGSNVRSGWSFALRDWRASTGEVSDDPGSGFKALASIDGPRRGRIWA